jgi:hypothetical protein
MTTTDHPLADAAAPARHDEHLCLVSAQATPNLTPLLDPTFAPRRVTLLVSPAMRAQADWLTDVIRPRGIAVERLDAPDPWDLGRITDTVVQWLDARGDTADVALNVTGGTKPMAIAAQQAFAMAEKPVFYVHHERDEVLWLTPRRPSHRLGNRLKLDDYLKSHGWAIDDRPPWPRPTLAQQALTRDLVLNVGTLADAIGRLNGYASKCAERKVLAIRVERRDLGDAGFVALVRKFEDAGIVSRHDDLLEFAGEPDRFYCNGGWLEQHVAAVIDAAGGELGLQDRAAGLKVRSLDNTLRGDAGRNELDLAFIARNRLYLIECKTRGFRLEGSAAEAVYKLDALTALGGLNTRGLLVSYRDLRSGDAQRARDLRIGTVIGPAVRDLRSQLLRWVSGSRST